MVGSLFCEPPISLFLNQYKGRGCGVASRGSTLSKAEGLPRLATLQPLSLYWPFPAIAGLTIA
ncbi:hypothetical protein [Adhaeribacter rhizoryzae]|uniref:Uncharacterized protein n=1 Tax=Adhaeribacter rhizoryzae TaxID=2607907 RepID=A0A5M6CUV8_9BACT|nr:hypothetical protein [Adhaeribacter rhizoryzae]KAA5538736.1 hypothetical protein F0145_25680 [Adhaeribacter rhizoryzae]